VLEADKTDTALSALDIMADADIVYKSAFGAAETHRRHYRAVADFNVANLTGSEQAGTIAG
jgi:hypothetical protein